MIRYAPAGTATRCRATSRENRACGAEVAGSAGAGRQHPAAGERGAQQGQGAGGGGGGARRGQRGRRGTGDRVARRNGGVGRGGRKETAPGDGRRRRPTGRRRSMTLDGRDARREKLHNFDDFATTGPGDRSTHRAFSQVSDNHVVVIPPSRGRSSSPSPDFCHKVVEIARKTTAGPDAPRPPVSQHAPAASAGPAGARAVERPPPQPSPADGSSRPLPDGLPPRGRGPCRLRRKKRAGACRLP